jgi:hypothetical protein
MKYLKCGGVALLSNAAVGGFCALKQEEKLETFKTVFGFTAGFSSFPAIIATGIDKLVNQNISSNKYFQYGATALEAGLMSIGVSSCLFALDSGKYLETFKEKAQNLVNLDTSEDSIATKIFFIGAMIQGMAFKYFLEDEKVADELQPEIDSDHSSHIKPFFPNMDGHLSNMYSDL